MTFTPSIQSLTGAHTYSGPNDKQIAIDWVRERVFIGIGVGTNVYMARVGLISGLEEVFEPQSTYAANLNYATGIDRYGDIYVEKGDNLNVGGVLKISGDTLQPLAHSLYPARNGAGGWANVIAPGGNYMLDNGLGNAVIPLTGTMISNDTTWVATELWPNSDFAFVCAGKNGTHKAFFLEYGDLTALYLNSISLGVIISASAVGTIVPTDIDPAWTDITASGMCLDETDGNLLVQVNHSAGATQLYYIIKVDITDASVLWACPINKFVSSTSVGIFNQMGNSRIRNERLAVITPNFFGSPPTTVTIIDTSDGSSTSYTDNLAGLGVLGPQSYDDTLGAIVLATNFSETTGSPTRLNSTAAHFSGWMVLYVDEAIEPPGPPDPIESSDTVTPYVPPVIIPPVRQLRLYPRPPFKEYRCGAQDVSVFPIPFRIMEQADLRVQIDDAELSQSDLVYTGRASNMAGHETGYVTLNEPVSNCIVRIWADRAPTRTTDHDDGEFSKAEANADFETLWLIDRCQELMMTRETEDPLTGDHTLPAAYAGMRYWFQGDCVISAATGDEIYIAADSGNVLTGTGETSLCELICVKAGLWFVRTKTGTWGLDTATVSYRVTLAGDRRVTPAGDNRIVS